ncbi:hypothetical protein JHK84_035366 [Glycine max]|nr:hypothetical protein JHK84_035366 [Glycine max]
MATILGLLIVSDEVPSLFDQPFKDLGSSFDLSTNGYPHFITTYMKTKNIVFDAKHNAIFGILDDVGALWNPLIVDHVVLDWLEMDPFAKLEAKATIDLENIEELTCLESTPLTFKRTTRSVIALKFSTPDPPSTQLRQLQTQKSTYAANFQVVEAEQQANLAKQKHLNKRIVDLIVELGWLNMLNPKITLPNSKLKGNLDLCVHLSALANSFHTNIIHLLYQHEGQEKDLSTTVNAHNISTEYQIDVLC